MVTVFEDEFVSNSFYQKVLFWHKIVFFIILTEIKRLNVVKQNYLSVLHSNLKNARLGCVIHFWD